MLKTVTRNFWLLAAFRIPDPGPCCLCPLGFNLECDFLSFPSTLHVQSLCKPIDCSDCKLKQKFPILPTWHRFSTVMAPPTLMLQRRLRATTNAPAQTPYEREFRDTVLPQLREALHEFQHPDLSNALQLPNLWQPLKAVLAMLGKRLRQVLLMACLLGICNIHHWLMAID